MTMTATDSITKGQMSEKSKHLSSEGSKVRRGFTVFPKDTPSIPSRYMTLTTSNSEKRGFQQTAKRFQCDQNCTPGPGHYETFQSMNKQLEKTSDSKKGSGSFASKSERDTSMKVSKYLPAPTTYNIAGLFGNEHQDFNRTKYSSMFQRPIADRPISPKALIPAPNQYNIDHASKTIARSNNVTAQAAFRSHTKRSIGQEKHFLTPAPGSYNVDNIALRSLGPTHHSSFKTTSKRDTFGVQLSSDIPGPADYRPYEKLDEEPHRLLLPRRHYLAISAPAIPPPPEAPYPGPGAYELRNFKEPEKKYMSSAAFVSNTSRWNIGAAPLTDIPGPASYTPRAPIKQSFNFNFEHKWIS